MFITDLDGTLFTDDKQINPIDLRALERLGEMGFIRVFATGRSLYSFQKAVERMGFDSSCEELPVDYLICSTGACIIKLERKHGIKMRGNIINRKENIIQKHSLESGDVSHIADYFDSLKLDYMIHRPVPYSHHCIYREQSRMPNPDFILRIEIYKDFITKINHSEPIKDFGQATELLTIIPAEIFAQHGNNTVTMIEEALPEFSVVRATSPLDGKSVWIEVFNRMVSKSQAISWLADQLKIQKENVAAIGNDYNDLDMLERAGHVFIVNNAPKELKDKVSDKREFAEVGSNNNCGVSEAINILLQR